MTKRIYKTAQGKTVDLGALILQNENVRAVGNMNVNARGDLVDSTNQTIDKKNQQIQRQYRQTTSSAAPQSHPIKKPAEPKVATEQTMAPVQTTPPVVEEPQAGLAGAMARSRATKK